MAKFLFTNSTPQVVFGLGGALSELGHQVQITDLGREYQLNPEFLREQIAEFFPDYVVTEGGWGNLTGILFPTLYELKIPHVFWANEDPPFFDTVSIHYAIGSQYVFTTAAECIEQYKDKNITAHLMSFACLPSFHHQIEPHPRFNHDLIFVGNFYPQFGPRVVGMKHILQPLINKNYDVKVYGLDWWLDSKNRFSIPAQYYGGFLFYEEMRVAYSSAKIVLGMHSVNTSPTMMSMRTFEALGCGAFYLTQWTPAIENLFQNHVHLVWSKSAEETIELVDYYLTHPLERDKIAHQGQAEVYDKHTYHHRVRDMIEVLTGSPPNNKAKTIPSREQLPEIKIKVNKTTLTSGSNF